MWISSSATGLSQYKRRASHKGLRRCRGWAIPLLCGSGSETRHMGCRAPRGSWSRQPPERSQSCGFSPAQLACRSTSGAHPIRDSGACATGFPLRQGNETRHMGRGTWALYVVQRWSWSRQPDRRYQVSQVQCLRRLRHRVPLAAGQ